MPMLMRVILLFLLISASCKVNAQVKLYEDQFNGGVTGGSFSTGVSGTGSGVIDIHIDSTATIRKAYLLVGRLGPAAPITVNLNTMVLVFDASTQATPDFQCSLYGGLSAVHAIDITSQVNPAVSTFNISYSQAGGGTNFFTDFYLYVAYENNSLPLVNTVIFLKTTDFIVTEQYTLNLTYPIDTLVPVGFAMHAGYMCNTTSDGENITVESVLLGNIGGGDPTNPSGLCSGTAGSFYYENNTLFGLQFDNPNQAMMAYDALSDLKNVLQNGTDTFDVQFEHFGGFGSSPDNSMWAWIMAYGISNVQPTAIFSAPNHICPGTCADFTNLSLYGNSFLWDFPGGNPSVSTDVNPTGICYNSPGQYDVTLIASNSNGSDTLTLPNYITVYPFPAPQGIMQNGDTLFANPGASSYQWYYDGNLIPGATDYYYIAPQSGNYNVVATDENDCEVEAAIFDIIAGLTPPDSYRDLSKGEGVTAFPNPVSEILILSVTQLSGADYEISIHNILGEKMNTRVITSERDSQKETVSVQLDVSDYSSGIYILELYTDGKIFHSQFKKK